MEATLQAEKERVLETKMAVNCAIWAKFSNIKLANGIFSFDDRPFLLEPMTTQHPRKGAMKATQMGFSTAMCILPSFHALIHGIIKSILYLFPSLVDMTEYSQSTIDRIIKDNPHTIGKYIKQTGKSVDKVSLKRIGDGYLHLRGARLNPSDIGVGEGSSSRLSGIAVGWCIFDETDFMDSAVMSDARGRMKGIPEEQRREIYLANPKASNYGIDLFWQQSDQRYLYHKCSCGTLSCPTLDFIDNPEKTVGFYNELGPLGEKRGYIRCRKCEKPVNVLNCEYHPLMPSNKKYMFWQCSHLSYINDNPARILHDFRYPPENNLGGVYKNDLGLPYSSSEEALSKSMVLSCCGREAMPENHTGPCAIGVDNDDNKHVVVGIRTGNDRYELLRFLRTTTIDFNEVYDLIRRYNVKFGVVDIRPNKDSAVQFQKAAASAGCKIFLCEYTDSPLQDANFNDTTGVVKVYRTGIFDTTHRIIANQQIVLPRQSPTVEEFARQCCNCVKSKDERRKDVVIYRYVKTGDQHDHYRNALNYFTIAANRVQKVNRFKNENKELKFCKCEDLKI